MKLCAESDSFILLKSWHNTLGNSAIKSYTDTGIKINDYETSLKLT